MSIFMLHKGTGARLKTFPKAAWLTGELWSSKQKGAKHMDKSQEIAEALSELDHVVQESWGLKLVRNLDWQTNTFLVI